MIIKSNVSQYMCMSFIPCDVLILFDPTKSGRCITFYCGLIYTQKYRICFFHTKKQQIINHQQLSGLILKKFENMLNTATITKIIKIENVQLFGQEIQKIQKNLEFLFKKIIKNIIKKSSPNHQNWKFSTFWAGNPENSKKARVFSKNHQKHYQKIITKIITLSPCQRYCKNP